jgi:hypothetical protein
MVFGGGRPLGFGLDLRPAAERRGRRGRPLLAGWDELTHPGAIRQQVWEERWHSVRWSGEEARRVDGPSTGGIEGIMRTESSGRPIAGAFLQLLGSGSATFADASGRYRLSFDPALVDVCRSQLVRVTAPGFRARTMILGMGFQSDNVIDLAVRP